MINKASGIMNQTQTMETLPYDVPALVGIGDARLPHGSLVHACEHGIGQLEHIRQPLLRRLPAGTEDFLPINVVLHRLEFGGGQFRIGRIHVDTLPLRFFARNGKACDNRNAFSLCWKTSILWLLPCTQRPSLPVR